MSLRRGLNKGRSGGTVFCKAAEPSDLLRGLGLADGGLCAALGGGILCGGGLCGRPFFIGNDAAPERQYVLI